MAKQPASGSASEFWPVFDQLAELAPPAGRRLAARPIARASWSALAKAGQHGGQLVKNGQNAWPTPPGAGPSTAELRPAPGSSPSRGTCLLPGAKGHVHCPGEVRAGVGVRKSARASAPACMCVCARG